DSVVRDNHRWHDRCVWSQVNRRAVVAVGGYQGFVVDGDTVQEWSVWILGAEKPCGHQVAKWYGDFRHVNLSYSGVFQTLQRPAACLSPRVGCAPAAWI